MRVFKCNKCGSMYYTNNTPNECTGCDTMRYGVKNEEDYGKMSLFMEITDEIKE